MPIINIQTFLEQITKAVIDTLEAQQAAVVIGNNELKADYIDRIFLRGENVNGTAIGSYSKKPYYQPLISSSQVKGSALQARGIKNSGDFKNKNKRKSQYMPGGYHEYRAVVGRQNAFVDLNLTGSLKGDIRLGQDAGSINISFTTDKQLLIAQGNQDRFGGDVAIFAASESEIARLVETNFEMVSEAFFNAFK